MRLPNHQPSGWYGSRVDEAPSTRERALEGALALTRAGRSISLDATAAESGLSKPGLMHHFRTKEALMLALVDRVVDHWERELAARLPVPVEQADVGRRLRAYVDWTLSGHFDESDLVMLCDPRLRRPLLDRWTERMSPWLALPARLPLERRARFHAARMLADGAWFADATSTFPLADDERAHVRSIALDLLEDPS